MFSKINVIDIFRKHFDTFRSYKTKKVYLPNIILFIIFPSIVSLILISFSHLLSKELANIIATSFSVFAGLLLNLLLILFDLVDKEENKKNERIILLLKELYSNISFCILISVIIVFSLFSLFFDIPSWLIRALSFWVYYFLFMFVLTLMMVLKRIDKMLSIKFKSSILYSEKNK